MKERRNHGLLTSSAMSLSRGRTQGLTSDILACCHPETERGDHDLSQSDSETERGDHDLSQSDSETERGDHDVSQSDSETERGDYDLSQSDSETERGDHDLSQSVSLDLFSGESAAKARIEPVSLRREVARSAG